MAKEAEQEEPDVSQVEEALKQETGALEQGGSCLSSGGKAQCVIIRRPDVTYAAFFTCSIS